MFSSIVLKTCTTHERCRKNGEIVISALHKSRIGFESFENDRASFHNSVSIYN